MRTLSSTLLAAQKSTSIKALAKIVLTLSGETTRTYHASSGTDRILNIKHPEATYQQTAEVLIDNANGNLTSIDFKGYKGVISYGATTSAGDEYSSRAPLWVIGQQLLSWQGRLACSLALGGTPNLLDTQGASAIYAPDSTNTDTVKTILTAIVEATLAPYTNYHAFTITFDDEAEGFFATSLINTFQPKDSFSIARNESRLSAMRRLLGYTDCVMRIGSDGEIHIFVPTTSGSTYDSEYELGADNHAFFSMSNRKRLVIPYYVQVDSHPTHDDGYTGYAEDTATATLVALDDTLDQREYRYLRLSGNTQAGNIADAILSHYQLDAEKGSASIPINFGAEVYDYVNCIDSRDNDTSRVANIGYLNTEYSPGKLTMNFRCGSILLGGLAGTMAPALSESSAMTDPGGGVRGPTLASLQAQIDMLMAYMASLIDAINYLLGLETEEDADNPFAGYIWIDDNGTVHIRPTAGQVLKVYEDMVPDTTNEDSVGTSSLEWVNGYIKKAYHDTRLIIPVGTNMYD